MPRGGARPNTGPKKGSKHRATLEKEAARALYQQRMTQRFEALLDTQYQTACGVSQFVYRDKSGRFKVIDDPDELDRHVTAGTAIEIFTRLPNAQAQTDILNRLMDKPKEQAQDLNIRGQFDVVAILKQRHARLRASQ